MKFIQTEVRGGQTVALMEWDLYQPPTRGERVVAFTRDSLLRRIQNLKDRQADVSEELKALEAVGG